ncbi:MAG: carboxypeptidase-like regulatory domain-containing protein, partial [Bacteroidota bacterium]
IKVSGKIFNKADSALIINAVIFVDPGKQVVTSDHKGEYSLFCSSGNKHFTTRVLGYKSANLNLRITSDTVLNIYLQVLPYELNEVTITGDSIKYVKITSKGSFILTPAAIHETPKLFSEPDLLKSLQFLPGVISGKEGTSDLYVRGGGAGQNIMLANGCYFFLPSHLLGIVSPYDLDFLESAELYKDYIPSDIGGGASSVIKLDFRKPLTDSISIQVRLGLLSSGLILDLPFKKQKWDISAGLKRSNYSLYAPLLKRIVPSDVNAFLPPDRYSFYDGFIKVSHYIPEWGKFSYLFFGNYDNGTQENKYSGKSGDTTTIYKDGIVNGWNSMTHAFQLDQVEKGAQTWKFNLNYNRVATGRKIYSLFEKSVAGSDEIGFGGTMYSFFPVINNIGASADMTKIGEKYTFSAGISDRLRIFATNNFASNSSNGIEIKNDISTSDVINETSLFFSTGIILPYRLKLDAGLRLTGLLVRDANFMLAEPRIKLSYNESGEASIHFNYVRLSQSDHSIEGSNAGLRTTLWLPVSKDFGPEISDIISGGFQGKIKNDLVWMIGGYYKIITGMVDYKPGASFIFDTSFVDLLDRIRGRAYGLEAGLVKRTGNLTGSVSYTYSRSKREWGSPEGIIWIPSIADRPHNLNLTIKYHYKKRTSFGLNFIYQSGAPATIYMHETSYGEFFETKNNVRYFNYHRLDLSVRHVFPMRRLTFFLDADIYNIYNRKNTFYFKKTFDNSTKSYYFKNISLFPIMPTLTLTIKY